MTRRRLAQASTPGSSFGGSPALSGGPDKLLSPIPRLVPYGAATAEGPATGRPRPPLPSSPCSTPAVPKAHHAFPGTSACVPAVSGSAGSGGQVWGAARAGPGRAAQATPPTSAPAAGGAPRPPSCKPARLPCSPGRAPSPARPSASPEAWLCAGAQLRRRPRVAT